MNSQKPPYEELKKMLDYERSIKNSLYYFLTFKNLMQSYVAWANVEGLDNLSQSTKRMNGFRKIHALIESTFTNDIVFENVEYTINPNEQTKLNT